jgi:hypothetical protein
MELARGVHADAVAADTPEARAKATLTYHRAARLVRQTLALEIRLVRELARFEEETRAARVRERESRVRLRRDQARAAVERAIWTEHDGEQAENLRDILDSLLDEDELADGFTDGPLEAYVLRLRKDLRLGRKAGAEAQGPPPLGEVSAKPTVIPELSADDPEFDSAEPPLRWRSSG